VNKALFVAATVVLVSAISFAANTPHFGIAGQFGILSDTLNTDNAFDNVPQASNNSTERTVNFGAYLFNSFKIFTYNFFRIFICRLAASFC
jgi:F0F1-type ATP synthase assembly protein I